MILPSIDFAGTEIARMGGMMSDFDRPPEVLHSSSEKSGTIHRKRSPSAVRIIFLRRTSEQGKVRLLGHIFLVDENWPHRLVRAEVDLDD